MCRVKRIKCGNGNCYIVSQSGKAILIDTARPKYRQKILRECEGENIQLIVLTHTHMDHCQNAAFLSEKLKAPIAICKTDKELIKDNMKQPLVAKMLLGKLVLAISLSAF